MKNAGFSGPITAHYEFPGLGGVENGNKELKGITRNELITIMRRNLTILRDMLKETGLA
jgi:hypothetical protein